MAALATPLPRPDVEALIIKEIFTNAQGKIDGDRLQRVLLYIATSAPNILTDGLLPGQGGSTVDLAALLRAIAQKADRAELTNGLATKEAKFNGLAVADVNADKAAYAGLLLKQLLIKIVNALGMGGGGGATTLSQPIFLPDAQVLPNSSKVVPGLEYPITGTTWNGNITATVFVMGLTTTAYAPVGYMLDTQDKYQWVSVDVIAGLVDTEAVRDAHLVQYGELTLNSSGRLQVPLLLAPGVPPDAVIEELLVPLPTTTPPVTPPVTPPASGKPNLLTNTNLADATAWSAGDLIVTGGQAGPAGGTSAVLAAPNTTNTDNHNLRSAQPLTGYAAGRALRYTLEGKPAGYRYVSLAVVQVNNSATLATVLVDLQTGTVISNPSGLAVAPVALAAGYYRMELGFTANGNDFFLFPKIWDNATNASYAGNGTSGVYLINPVLQDA